MCLRGLCTRNARREYQATHRASGVREACLLWRTDINGAVASASPPTPGPCSELPHCMFSLHRCLGAKDRRIWLGQTERTMSVLSIHRRRECLTLALFLRSVEMRELAFDARVSCPLHLGGIDILKSSDGRRLFTIRRPKAGELSAHGPCMYCPNVFSIGQAPFTYRKSVRMLGLELHRAVCLRSKGRRCLSQPRRTRSRMSTTTF